MKKNKLNLKFLIVLVFLGSVFVQAQELSLQGQVSIHNSQYQTGTIEYVQNAYVNADFATPTETDVTGKFELVFQSITRGDTVDLTIEKDEYEIVNKRALQNVVLGRITPLEIYLAPKGQLTQAQTKLYKICLRTITSRHDALIVRLKKNGEEKKAVIQQLEQQLNREIAHHFEAEEILNEQLEVTKNRLPEIVKKLAVINLDFASETYRQAFEFYKLGEIEQAINSLDEGQLANQTNETLANLDQLEKDKTAYQRTLEQVQEKVNQIVQSYTLKSEAYSLIFDYRSAVDVYKKAVELLEKTKTNEDLELANAYEVLGFFCRNLGDYQTALDYFKKNITIKENILSAKDTLLAFSYNNISTIYFELGKYEEALNLQKESIRILEQSLDSDTLHPVLASCYNNLSLIYSDLGEYGKALRIQQKAITIQKQVLEPDHPDLAIANSNLSTIYLRMGDINKGIEIQQKVIKIRERILESTHPDLAVSYHNLSSMYLDLKQYEKAFLAQKKALKIQRKIFPKDHPSLAKSYHNIGFIFGEESQLDSALYYEKKVYAIWKEILPEEHQNLFYVNTNLRVLYNKKAEQKYKNKDYAVAIENYHSSLFYDGGDPHDTEITNNIGLCFFYSGAYSKAIEYYEKSYQLDTTRLSIYLNNTSLAYTKLKAFHEAKYRLIKLQKLNSKNWRVYRTWAIYYALQEDKDSALLNLEKALNLGFKNLTKIKNEEAFKILHQEPRYQAIIQKLQNKK